MNTSASPSALAPQKPRRRFNWSVAVAVFSLVLLFLAARYAVTHFRRPGSMSVIEAQAMDMSAMRPPVGAVPVEVAAVSRGQIRARVTYSGSVLAFTTTQIAPRVTGRIVAIPIYPGDRVKSGQLLVQLDSDELRAKENGARFARQSAGQDQLIAADEADAARAAQSQARAEASRASALGEEGAAQIRLAQANARGALADIEAAQRGVLAAQSEARAQDAQKRVAQAEIGDASANLAQSQSDVETARAAVVEAQNRLPQVQADIEAARADVQFAQNKRDRSAELLKQGAISREEFQSDDAALTNSQSRLSAAKAKIGEANAAVSGAQASVRGAQAKESSARAKLGGTRAAISRADADIAAATEKVAQMRVAVENARAKASGSQAEIAAERARAAQSQSGIGVAAAQSQGAGASVSKARNQASRAATLAAQADAALSEAEIVRGYTQIRAESDGLVTKRVMTPGTLVSPGQTLLEIEQIDRVRFQASVAQSDLDSIQAGSPVQIRSASNPSKRLQTLVSAVFPAADAGSRTGIIEAVAPNPRGIFKPGEAIVMEIAATNSSAGALKVPTEALVMSAQSGDGAQVVAMNERASVWLMERAKSKKPSIFTCTMHPQIREEKPGDCPICHMKLTPLEAGGAFRARLVSVETGATDGDFTEITRGISGGAQVITRGYDDLKDGDAVVAAKFGADGPIELPSANSGEASQSPTAATSSQAAKTAGLEMGGSPANAAEIGSGRQSRNATKSAPAAIQISVDGQGFSPATFHLKKGVVTRLIFTRTTDATCATSIVWPDFKLTKKLPLNVPTTLEITPKTSGVSSFACGMNMLKGQAVVQ